MEHKRKPASLKQLALFLLICFAVMGFSGLFQPGAYYESLDKAPWTPPNLAFPIVWFILYVFIAIAGQRIFAQAIQPLKWLWASQLVLNAAWSWLFFGQNWVALALLDIVVISVLVTSLMVRCWRAQMRSTAYLFMPYLAWLLIATSLNAYILVAN